MRSYKKYFIKAIKHRFPESAKHIIADTDKNYQEISIDTKFAATSKNPIDKRLDFCACFLALIKTLEKQGETFETIRNICLEITIEYVNPKNKLQKLLKKLPPKIISTWLGKRLLTVSLKK